MMMSLRLALLGATIAILISISEAKSQETKEHLTRSLNNHLKSLLTERRFVGQLATDCGLECKRRRAAQEVEEQLTEAKKRFMSLGASDCGSFECVLKKREAMETVKRFLTTGSEAHKRTVPSSPGRVQAVPTRRRHRRYIDLILGNNPFDYSPPRQSPHRPWENNYGSYGWNNYYGDGNNDNNFDYYNYDYDDDYYQGGSASGYMDEENDTDKGDDDVYTGTNDVIENLKRRSFSGWTRHSRTQ